MDWKVEFDKWISYKSLDHNLKKQLYELMKDDVLLEDAFYKHLEFGTGGIRGELGPGINRMNIYTIRRASFGLANYIVAHGKSAKERGLVIAYDSRHMSAEFAMEVAKTVGKHGVKVFLFDELRPTPELSFAVRYLNAFAGVIITASHNPPVYNGFKIYGEDGGQISPETAEKITQFIQAIDNELIIEVASKQQMLENQQLILIGEKIDDAYIQHLQSIQLNPEIVAKMANELEIVYSPLHGAGNKLVRKGLQYCGFKNITIVEEQEMPDANFSTVLSPNPEEPDAFSLAVTYGEKMDADILLATDPDADRLGVAVKNRDNQYEFLTGNQIGALMLAYILSQKQRKGILAENGIVIKTIVTSELGRQIADDYHIPTLDTLTGFKFIGEKINEFNLNGQYSFQFGYEESYGYLIGDFVRDKDAIQSAVIISEVAAFYKSKGMTLYEGLLEIYERYGYYQEALQSMTLKGNNGAEKMKHLLNYFRNTSLKEIANVRINIIEDYLLSKSIHLVSGKEVHIELPKSDVLKYKLADGSWFCIRSSGTEPKVKFYFGVVADTLDDSRRKRNHLQTAVMAIVEDILKTSGTV